MLLLLVACSLASALVVVGHIVTVFVVPGEQKLETDRNVYPIFHLNLNAERYESLDKLDNM